MYNTRPYRARVLPIKTIVFGRSRCRRCRSRYVCRVYDKNCTFFLDNSLQFLNKFADKFFTIETQTRQNCQQQQTCSCATSLNRVATHQNNTNFPDFSLTIYSLTTNQFSLTTKDKARDEATEISSFADNF